MAESDYASSFERITERVERIRLARALVKLGKRDEALKVLRALLPECEDQNTRTMVERLIADLEGGEELI